MQPGEVLNISPVVVWVIALSQLLTFSLTVWNLMSSGARSNAKQLLEHTDRFNRHEGRISTVEQSLLAMPNKNEMHLLQLEMSGLRGDIRVMQATWEGSTKLMERMENIVGRHEDHLLDGAKR